MPNPSQAALEDWVRKWQQILRLQDWEIRIELLRERDMRIAAEGLCSYKPMLKRARIQLRDPTDHDSKNFPADLEATLVHELLHLHFAPFYAKDENGAEQAAQEVAIELIALALVGLKRKGEGDAMAKKGGGGATKGKPMPTSGAKPAAMAKPPAGGGKMTKGKIKGSKGC